jgi:hypothetical protein
LARQTFINKTALIEPEPTRSIKAGIFGSGQTGLPNYFANFCAASSRTMVKSFNSVPFSLTPFNSLPFNLTPFNLMASNLMSFNLAPFSLTPFSLTPFSLIPFNWTPFNLTPFNDLPFVTIMLSHPFIKHLMTVTAGHGVNRGLIMP